MEIQEIPQTILKNLEDKKLEKKMIGAKDLEKII